MQRIYKRHWRLTNSSQTTAKANEMVVGIPLIKDKWNCQSHCSKKNKQWVTSSTWVGTLCESCEFPRIRVTGGSGLGGRCLLASVADGSGFCWLLSFSLILHIWVFFRKKIRVHNPRLVILVKQLSREKRMKQIEQVVEYKSVFVWDASGNGCYMMVQYPFKSMATVSIHNRVHSIHMPYARTCC